MDQYLELIRICEMKVGPFSKEYRLSLKVGNFYFVSTQNQASVNLICVMPKGVTYLLEPILFTFFFFNIPLFHLQVLRWGEKKK